MKLVHIVEEIILEKKRLEHPLSNTGDVGSGSLFLFSVVKLFSRNYNVEFKQWSCLLIFDPLFMLPSSQM